MRNYVFDFSLMRPVTPDVTITTFPRDQVDRLFNKKTHYLDWMRFFWIGVMVTMARSGKLNATGRYRVTVKLSGIGKYEYELHRFV